MAALPPRRFAARVTLAAGLRALAADTLWDAPDPHRLARHFARRGLAG